MKRMFTKEEIEAQASTEWEKSLKEYVVQNGEVTEIGGDMEVDGDVEFNSTIVLNAGLTAINDTDGNSYFPEGQANKLLMGKADGTYELKSTISSTLVSSDSEASGKVFTATGNGGVDWQYPSASNISSGSATSGQVLTANGSGGVTFTTLSIPTVDQTYSASSTNAQSGTAVASAIAAAITSALGGNY